MICWATGHCPSPSEHLEVPRDLLSADELLVLAGLVVPKRRAEWLGGRMLAKALCRAHLARRGWSLAKSDFSILRARDGSPKVFARDGAELPITVSLSHSHGRAVAAVCDGAGAPLGIDLELCEPRARAFVEDFFTSREVVWVDEAEEGARAATEIWSLKESALKALRVGLGADTRSVEARPRAVVRAGWSRAGVSGPAFARGDAFVRDLGAFVVSLVWLGPSEPSLASEDFTEDSSAPAADGR